MVEMSPTVKIVNTIPFTLERFMNDSVKKTPPSNKVISKRKMTAQAVKYPTAARSRPLNQAEYARYTKHNPKVFGRVLLE